MEFGIIGVPKEYKLSRQNVRSGHRRAQVAKGDYGPFFRTKEKWHGLEKNCITAVSRATHTKSLLESGAPGPR